MWRCPTDLVEHIFFYKQIGEDFLIWIDGTESVVMELDEDGEQLPSSVLEAFENGEGYEFPQCASCGTEAEWVEEPEESQ